MISFDIDCIYSLSLIQSYWQMSMLIVFGSGEKQFLFYNITGWTDQYFTLYSTCHVQRTFFASDVKQVYKWQL